jgi:putative acetyltransferase
MSVAVEMRRQGVGYSILENLCEYARSRGVHRLVLETTETWSEVIEFYQRFGFQVTHSQGGDVYFTFELPESG